MSERCKKKMGKPLKILDPGQREQLVGFISALLLILAGWHFGATVADDPLKYPNPLSVVESIQRVGFQLLHHGGETWLRVLLALISGVLVGVPLGLLLRVSKLAAFVGLPAVELLRPVPPVALVPFLILWFGVSYTGQILLIAYAAGMTMVVGTYGAIGNINPAFLRAALCLGANSRRLVAEVIAPAIIPELLASLRIAAALSFAVAIVAEFMGAQSGLGFLIMVARRVLRTETIVLCVIAIGLESWLTDLVLRSLARRLTRWFRPASSAVA